jgi:hypothetical protein
MGKKLKSSELRIGNWVEGNSPEMIVKVISEHSISLYMPRSEADNFDFDIEDIRPIPLTHEVLIAGGFTTDEMKVEYSIGLPIGEGADLFIENEGHPSMSCGIKSFQVKFNYFKDVKYLHQVQNIYFSITGEELEYKPTLKQTS